MRNEFREWVSRAVFVRTCVTKTRFHVWGFAFGNRPVNFRFSHANQQRQGNLKCLNPLQ